MINFAFFLLSALAYPFLHTVSSSFFYWAEISPNISLVYLPAFLRLFNLLVLGPVLGTIATLLGGLFLQGWMSAHFILADYLHIACSGVGPLIAVWLFHLFRKRAFNISSPQDLIEVAILCGVGNALVHHLYWAIDKGHGPMSLFHIGFMALGDWLGIIVGVVIFAFILRFKHYFFKPSLE